MRRSRSLGLILSLAMVTAACSSAATPAPTAAPTAAPSSGSSGAPSGAVKTALVLPPAETTTLKIGLSNNLAVNQFISVVARDLGLFQKYGLNVEVLTMAGGAGDVVKGLVSNALQVGALSAGPALSAALTDSPMIVTGLDSSALFYSLLGAKDVKSAADLKGKAVAISTLGDVSHAAVLGSLTQMGLTAKDVVMQTIGNEQNRITALLAGAVAAAPVQNVNAAKVLGQGANLLADLQKNNIKFGLAGVTTTKEWATKNPNTMLRILASLLEAQKVMFTKPALAATAYQTFTTLDAATARASIDACIAGVCNKGLRFSKDDFALNKEVLLTVNPDVAKVDVASVIDLGPLDKLKSMGFNDEIEFP
jgi:NitT/TauT family transport system substrate-binding protein